MKKLKIILLSLFILIPINVKAFSITGSSINGASTGEVGQELSLQVKINYSDVLTGTMDSYGIATVGFELDYDDSVFVITGVSSEGDEWDNEVYKNSDNDNYIVLSMLTEDVKNSNLCLDGLLYCGSYNVTVNFFIKDSNKTSSTIKIGEIAVAGYKLSDDIATYLDVDATAVEDVSNASKTINITNSKDKVTNTPNSIVTGSKPKLELELPKLDTNTETSSKKPSTSTHKSSKYLSKLEIIDHNIDFKKDKNEYNIYVKKNVNSIIVKPKLEDSKGTYKVIGAEDLKKNKYKVLVEVTSSNGEKNTYTINVKFHEDQTTVTKEKESKKGFKIDKKYIIIAGIVIFIIMLIIIILKLRDRKMDKIIDENL